MSSIFPNVKKMYDLKEVSSVETFKLILIAVSLLIILIVIINKILGWFRD